MDVCVCVCVCMTLSVCQSAHACLKRPPMHPLCVCVRACVRVCVEGSLPAGGGVSYTMNSLRSRD